LVLAQSEPPILDSAGVSPPTYRVTWSSWSVGTNSRSPGAPRLAGAYSSTRYSRMVLVGPAPEERCTSSTNLATPCCSWTTKSPSVSCSGSTALRRFEGILRISRVEAAEVRPSRSASVSSGPGSGGSSGSAALMRRQPSKSTGHG
jgi:hypothetical protein